MPEWSWRVVGKTDDERKFLYSVLVEEGGSNIL